MLEQFLSLLRVGLWGALAKAMPLSHDSFFDWDGIVNLAKEQTVTGLVMAGAMESGLEVPEEVAVKFVHWMRTLTDRNTRMNAFIAGLFDELSATGINAVLVKGQGIAQCYEQPLWRQAGDVDLLLNRDDYEKAKAILIPRASSVQKENVSRLHLGMEIDGWSVELHGSLRTPHQSRMNKVVDRVQARVFSGGETRVWKNGSVDVLLPSPDNDIVFVFAHILQHFYGEGIGLRQICDWCRLLWKYRDSIDRALLQTRLKEMGVMREWVVFGYLAVHYLGMPMEAMPFYEDSPSMHRKADRLMSFIIQTGNFGHNRDMSYVHEKPFVIRKLISLSHSIKTSVWVRARIFPHNALGIFLSYFFARSSDALHGE